MTNSQSPQTELADDPVHVVADILARFPCRADEGELDKLRRFEVARYIVASLASRPSHLVDTGEALREADEATVSHIAKAVSKETGTSYFLVRRVARAVLAALAAHPKPEEADNAS